MSSPELIADRKRLAHAHFDNGDFHEAYRLYRELSFVVPRDWEIWFGAGQSARFGNDFQAACDHLKRAAKLREDPMVLLALGIAQQLAGRLDESRHTLFRALELDGDFATAFNSLALTQVQMGEYDKALVNYDAGTKALARTFIKTVPNSRDNPTFQIVPVSGDQWVGCGMFGALYSCAMADISQMRLVGPEAAMKEERERRYGGLFYQDSTEKGERVRLFLPNYLATFQHWLRRDSTYANLIGNQGSVYERKGDREAAERYFAEAADFFPETLPAGHINTDAEGITHFGPSRRRRAF